MKDAPTMLVGQIIDITNRHQNGMDKPSTGVRVSVMAPDDNGPGFAQVNISLDDAKLLTLEHFRAVAWIVRSAPYDITDRDTGARNAGMSVKFLRPVTEDDLDRIASQLNAPVAASK
jgi:hypothetical protein